MTDGICKGCGTVLNPARGPGRPKVWCSDSCRKESSYGNGVCTDCGGPTRHNGNGRPATRCLPCSNIANAPQRAATNRQRREDRWPQIAEMWRAGDSIKAIAAAVGLNASGIGREIIEMRTAGYDLPWRYQAAARRHDGDLVASASGTSRTKGDQ